MADISEHEYKWVRARGLFTRKSGLQQNNARPGDERHAAVLVWAQLSDF